MFLALVIIGGGGFIYAGSLLSSWSRITISEITVSGMEEGEAVSVRAAALDSLQGSYLGLFSRASSFLYPRSVIKAEIRRDHPEVASVSVARDGLRTVAIDIVEKEPSALICVTYPDFNGSDLALNDPGTCYFADETGYIFKKAPSFSGTVYHTYYVPDLASGASSTDSVIGRYATTTVEFARVQDFYAGVKAAGITVDAVFARSDGEYELYARNITGTRETEISTVVIYFTTTMDTAEQLSNLVSFWNHMKTTKPQPHFSDIKLQYPPNVYYTVSQ